MLDAGRAFLYSAGSREAITLQAGAQLEPARVKRIRPAADSCRKLQEIRGEVPATHRKRRR